MDVTHSGPRSGSCGRRCRRSPFALWRQQLCLLLCFITTQLDDVLSSVRQAEVTEAKPTPCRSPRLCPFDGCIDSGWTFGTTLAGNPRCSMAASRGKADGRPQPPALPPDSFIDTGWTFGTDPASW